MKLPIMTLALLVGLASMASASPGAREAVLSGSCFSNANKLNADVAFTGTTFSNLRGEYVNFNQKKSMYRDGEIIDVITLDEPGQKSLAGCANACLLDWAVDGDGQAIDNMAASTGCGNANNDAPCPYTTSASTRNATRECEAFNFNIDTGVCYLLSAQTASRLTRSDNFWSGSIVCDDITSVDDWANDVVSRR